MEEFSEKNGKWNAHEMIRPWPYALQNVQLLQLSLLNLLEFRKFAFQLHKKNNFFVILIVNFQCLTLACVKQSNNGCYFVLNWRHFIQFLYCSISAHFTLLWYYLDSLFIFNFCLCFTLFVVTKKKFSNIFASVMLQLNFQFVSKQLRYN